MCCWDKVSSHKVRQEGLFISQIQLTVHHHREVTAGRAWSRFSWYNRVRRTMDTLMHFDAQHWFYTTHNGHSAPTSITNKEKALLVLLKPNIMEAFFQTPPPWWLWFCQVDIQLSSTGQVFSLQLILLGKSSTALVQTSVSKVIQIISS